MPDTIKINNNDVKRIVCTDFLAIFEKIISSIRYMPISGINIVLYVIHTGETIRFGAKGEKNKIMPAAICSTAFLPLGDFVLYPALNLPKMIQTAKMAKR